MPYVSTLLRFLTPDVFPQRIEVERPPTADPNEVIATYFDKSGERWYLSEVVVDELLNHQALAFDIPQAHDDLLGYFRIEPGEGHSTGDLDESGGVRKAG